MEFSRLEELLITSVYSKKLSMQLISGGFNPADFRPLEDGEGEGALTELLAPGPNPVDLAALLMLADAVKTEDAFINLRGMGAFSVVDCHGPEWIRPLAKMMSRLLKPYGRVVSNPSSDYLTTYSSSHAYHVMLTAADLEEGYFTTSKKKQPTTIDDGLVLDCLAARRPTIAFVASASNTLSVWSRSLSQTTLEVPDLGADVLEKLLHILCQPSPGTVVPDLSKLLPTNIAVAFSVPQDKAGAIGRLKGMPTIGAEPLPPPITTSLDDLVGMKSLKKWGADLKSDLAAVKAGTLDLAHLPRGLLLSGPPGTGKSKGAKIVAHHAGLPVTFGSVGRWISVGDGHLGTFVRAMRGDFAKAAAAAPSMMIVDEIDAFPARGQQDSWFDAAQTALLEAMDGLDTAVGVITVGICNSPERLDPALQRAGRFDHKIAVEKPDIHELGDMFRLCLRPDLQDADFMPLASMVIGGTIADVDRICKDARRLARNAHRQVHVNDLITVVQEDRIVESAADRERTALHEAAHALVAHIEGIKIHWVSISVTGIDGTRGSVVTDLTGESWTFERVGSFVRQLLAGHAAEAAFLGGSSFGAGSDLQMATRVLARAAGSEGMMGFLAWHDPDQLETILRTPHLARSIDAALAEFHKQSTLLLSDNRLALHRLRDALLKHLFVDQQTVAALLSDVATTRNASPSGEERTC